MRSIAIVFGFLQGTWDMVDGLNRVVTGGFLPFHEWLAPGAHAAWLLVIVGAGWMLAGNVFLFQTPAATESSVGGDRGGGARNSEGRPAAVKRIPPELRSAVAEDGGSDAASRSRGGLERREASLANTRARSGFLAMIIVSSYYAGWLVLLPVAQLALLLIEASRASRSSSRNGAAA
jgi:hypothetical protein